MLYKMRNILLILLSLVLTNGVAKAQGLVSLSEEAMFEDELDTEIVKPKTTEPNIEAEIPVISDDNVKTKDALPDISSPKKAQETNDLASDKQDPFESVLTKNETTENNDNNTSDDFDIDGNYAKYIESPSSDLYRSLDGNIDLKSDDVFEHMSDIEKRTAILNLELRREKLQNDIEAIKFRRREALAKEKQKEEDQRLKNLEAEKEIERKIIEEQGKLRELDIQFEKVRQEKVLNAYKDKMLEETQKWIEHDGNFYKQIINLRNDNKRMIEDIKDKMTKIKTKAQEKRNDFVQKISDYKKQIEDKNSQIDILRTRVANLEKERENMKKNPFAGFDKAQLAAAAGIDIDVLDAFAKSQGYLSEDGNPENEPIESDLTKLYKVTEIRGKGGELIARLVNQNGTSFYVKKGTSLQSGHIISKITTTYVMVDRGDDRQYLYFSAGGILPTEVNEIKIIKDTSEENTEGNVVNAKKNKTSKKKKAKK